MKRMNLGRRSPTSWDAGFATCVFWGAGRVFKIQENLCAVLSQIISGKAYTHDKRTKREKGRPERVISSKPRATPWVSAHKRLRPVRAKVWANGWLLLLPLQGVGNGDMVPRALPWATDLLGFQPAQGRRQGFFRTISIYLIFQFWTPYPSRAAGAEKRDYPTPQRQNSSLA